MRLSTSFRILLLLALIAFNTGCDQVSKAMVRQQIAPDEVITVIEPYFVLTKVENTGAAMSAFSNLPQVPKILVLQVLPLVLLTLLFVWVIRMKKQPWLLSIAICFYIGGGLGNIWDRLLYGSVTDFMFIHVGLFKTGIFNFADVSVMVGTALLLIYAIQEQRSKRMEPTM
ncbi:MAG TPA: signal peptidase II [Cytophagales bacterium]|nr:signal peptidase II [Cytophagales bacterium]HAA24194.1 signal peptidase II [Cytophagales bacterium]HAP63479.1 signal peptidase II [Cytophagales bacterium]